MPDLNPAPVRSWCVRVPAQFPVFVSAPTRSEARTAAKALFLKQYPHLTWERLPVGTVVEEEPR